MLARFNGNVVPFADDATSTNRTVFGGTTQSDTLDDNLNADFKKGWEIVGLNDNPTREDFNAMGYTLGALTAYLYEMGISEWNSSQNYRIGSRVIGSDGKIYKALTGTIGTPNVNHNPTSDTINWEWELKSFVPKTTSTDNAIVRFNGTTSDIQNSSVIIEDSGRLLITSPTGGLGYGTGSGGGVTQITSKSTSVTLNKPTGFILTNNAALAAGATVVFQVNNSIVTNDDNVFLTNNYNVSYSLRVADVNDGNFLVALKNETAGSLSEAVVFNFTIIKGANS